MRPLISSVQTPTLPPAKEAALREAAQKLEATFLAEMLKAAGLGQPRESFGGGVGEDQFGSFLVQEQALQMVRAGGIGLSEALFETLKERENER
jgi:Rod binding domain-containing protein